MYVEYPKLFYTIEKSARTFLIIKCHAQNHSEIAYESTHIEDSIFFIAISLARKIPLSSLSYIRYTVSFWFRYFSLIFEYFIINVDSVHYLRQIRKTDCLE